MKGRTIKIHLVEGTPSGVMTAEIIASWTGQVILAPRTELVALAKRSEVQRSGVYILVGDDPDYPGREQVYIGESENVLVRLKNHIRDDTKEFWNRTIIVVSKDEHLTKSLVRYLESRLIQVVSQSRRATLSNGTAPDCPRLPESDVADMEYFLAQIQMLLPVLGFSFILSAPVAPVRSAAPNVMPSVVLPQAQDVDSPVFEMNTVGAKATAQEIAGEFVVISGSTARSYTASHMSQGYAQLQQQLLDQGKLSSSSQDGFWLFTEDVPFNSPSAAAATIAGANKNGPQTWRVQGTSQTYKQWQQARIDAQAPTTDEIIPEADDPQFESQLIGEEGLSLDDIDEDALDRAWARVREQDTLSDE